MLLSKQNLFWFSPKASSSSCRGNSWITFLALSLNSITKTVKFLLSGMMAGKFEKSTFNRIWKITAIPLKKKFFFVYSWFLVNATMLKHKISLSYLFVFKMHTSTSDGATLIIDTRVSYSNENL